MNLQRKSVKGVYLLIGALTNTFWSSWFGIWEPKDVSISFYGTGDEAWELTSYENATEFVATLVLDEKATGFQRYKLIHYVPNCEYSRS